MPAASLEKLKAAWMCVRLYSVFANLKPAVSAPRKNVEEPQEAEDLSVKWVSWLTLSFWSNSKIPLKLTEGCPLGFEGRDSAAGKVAACEGSSRCSDGSSSEYPPFDHHSPLMFGHAREAKFDYLNHKMDQWLTSIWSPIARQFFQEETVRDEFEW